MKFDKGLIVLVIAAIMTGAATSGTVPMFPYGVSLICGALLIVWWRLLQIAFFQIGPFKFGNRDFDPENPANGPSS